MINAFNALVKTQHEALKSTLGVRTIPVIDESTVKKIKVTQRFTVLTPSGSKLNITKEQLSDYDALGLSVRRVS